MLFGLVPLAIGILDDSENMTRQQERQLKYNVK